MSDEEKPGSAAIEAKHEEGKEVDKMGGDLALGPSGFEFISTQSNQDVFRFSYNSNSNINARMARSSSSQVMRASARANGSCVVSKHIVAGKDIPRLMSFVPEQVLPLLASTTELRPCFETSDTLVMLADISGFTKLSENLCSKGPEGVDALSEIISDFLGALIRIIKSYSGDVISFAGDALIITWPRFTTHENPEETVLRVFHCGLQLAAVTRPNLTVHVGIASGKTTFCVIGGANDYWCCLLAGSAIIRMGDAELHAESQEVVATLETYELVKSRCVIEDRKEKRSKNSHEKGDFDRPRGLVKIVAVDINEGKPSCTLNVKSAFSQHNSDAELATNFSQLLQGFVPEPALQVLRGNGQYLNEYRKRISVLFLMLDNFPFDIYSPDSNGSDLCTQFQSILIELQKVLFANNGLLRQFIVDDKGCVFIACFGVTGYTHWDDPARALNCGLLMERIATAMNYQAFIGLSTGAAFCGAVGSPDRREYAMVGKDVNLAARLMGQARKLGFSNNLQSILVCDDTTYLEAKTESGIQFAALEPTRLKGYDNPVPMYHASFKEKQEESTTLIPAPKAQIEAATINPEFLDEIQSHLVSPQEKLMLAIEGEQGIGKSTLLASLKRKLTEDSDSVGVFLTKGHIGSGETPFAGFRHIFWVMLLDYARASDEPDVPKNKSTIEKEQREVLVPILEAMAERHLARLRKEQERNETTVLQPAKPLKRAPTILRSTGKMYEDNTVPNSLSTSAIDICEDLENEEYQKLVKAKFIESEAFPFLKHTLQVSWDLEKKLKAGNVVHGKRRNSIDLNNSNSGTYLISLAVACAVEMLETKYTSIILFIDDAHWMDSLSRKAAVEIVRQTSVKTRLAIALQSAYGSSLDRWMECGRFRMSQIPKGKDSDMRALIETVQGGPDLSKEMKEFIIEQSDGNPSQCKQLTHSIAISNDGAFGETIGGGIGALFEHAIQAHFDRLPDANRAILKTAAVIGYSFPAECLMTMLPRYLSRKGIKHIQELLDDLVKEEWLDKVDDQHGPGYSEHTYSFHNASAWDVCYNLNTSRNLKMLHLAAAHYFEKTYDEDLRPFFSLLSSHYLKSGNDHVAIRFLMYAFRLSVGMGAIPEASEQLDQIIPLSLPEERMRSVLQECGDILDRFSSQEKNLNMFQSDLVPKTNSPSHGRRPTIGKDALLVASRSGIDAMRTNIDRATQKLEPKATKSASFIARKNSYKDEQDKSTSDASKACTIL